MLLSQIPAGFGPLTADQGQQMQQLMGTLSPVQQAWISGFLAASASGTVAAADTAQAAPLTVLYGSQTGNAKHLAQEYAEKAKARGLDVKLVDMADYKPNC